MHVSQHPLALEELMFLMRLTAKQESWTANYAAQISPINHGVLEFINQDLFNAQTCPNIRLQMYKLNVYGPGSFFRTHVDTPRGVDMFGSLVIILPTNHEGGSLIFRHAGEEWVIDTANAVKSNSPASPVHAAFSAFYSDVEYEVTPVTSGYRVTLTYLLYFAGSTSANQIQPQSSAQQELHRNMNTLLNVPEFLPAGGYVGFKLVHKYSLSDEAYPDLRELRWALKGPDARLLGVCEAFGLSTSLRLFYRADDDEEPKYFSKCAIVAEGNNGDYFSIEEFIEESDGKMVEDFDLETGINFKNIHLCNNGSSKSNDGDTDEQSDDSDNLPKVPIFWINPDNEALTKSGSQYKYYIDNEACIGYLYGEIALVIKVGPHGNRQNGRDCVTIDIPNDL